MPRPDAETLPITILEGIGLPFYAVDRDWQIYLYNGAAERHFGNTADEMIGATFRQPIRKRRRSSAAACRATPWRAERKRQEAEEALRRRSAELEAVLETIKTAV